MCSVSKGIWRGFCEMTGRDKRGCFIRLIRADWKVVACLEKHGRLVGGGGGDQIIFEDSLYLILCKRKGIEEEQQLGLNGVVTDMLYREERERCLVASIMVLPLTSATAFTNLFCGIPIFFPYTTMNGTCSRQKSRLLFCK